MFKTLEDLTGRRFGHLLVLKHAGTHVTSGGGKKSMWECRCDCGNITTVRGNDLKKGTTKSCGCEKNKRFPTMNTTHGCAKRGKEDRLYGIWKNMKHRCYNKNDSHYDKYGGKGVSVCDEWKDDYPTFKTWAYNNGYDDSAEFGKCTIDRIDNDGDYCPDNCRWVNQIAQMNNTSRNHYIELNGKRMTIAEFARVMNISANHAYYYLNKFEKGSLPERRGEGDLK